VIASVSRPEAWTPFGSRGRNPEPALRLFCLPHAGGGASLYRTWSAALPTDIDVCPVQLPGRETRAREAPLSRLRALVPAIAEGLLPMLDAPFAFFGHSMGGLLGFELARYLRRQWGRLPVRLLVAGHRAPHLPRRGSSLHSLPEPHFSQELRTLGGTPAEVLDNRELMNVVAPVLRADFAVCETYEYAPDEPLACPISVFGGLDDRMVPPTDLSAWGEHTRSGFSVRLLPGNHFFVRSAPAPLLQAIAGDLL
jgi:medium-chain acyl-[acyl-carrier-protein] hydrolase